jgi:cell division septum initiation protein DivIVA
MSKEEVIAHLEIIEREMADLKKRVQQLSEENGRLRTILAAVDDRTKQFKTSVQKGHPDGHYMEW